MSDQWTQEQQMNWKQAYVSLIEFGRSALTSSALLNGGAAAAIITAATANTSTDTSIKLSSLLLPIFFFSIGAAFALFALGLAYLSELCFLQQYRGSESRLEFQKIEYPVRWLAMSAGVASILLFVGGILTAFSVLS